MAGNPAERMRRALDLHQAGRLDEADHLYRAVLEERPDHAEALHYRGVLVLQQGASCEAVALIRRSLAVAPERVAAWCDLGVALRAQGDLAEAEEAFLRALAREPDMVEAQINLGLVHQDRGELEEAERRLRCAVALAPDLAEAHYNLGNLLFARLDYLGAVAAYQRALALDPGHVAALCNLGSAHREVGRINDARICYERAIAIDPNFAEAHSNLGTIFKDQGRMEDAVAAFRRALEIDPGRPAARSNLLFCLCFKEDEDPDEVFGEHLLFEKIHAAPLADEIRPHPNLPDPERRLRVGFVSPDLRFHPGGHYYLPMVEGLDRERFEVACYYTYTLCDEWTEQFRTAADLWREAAHLSDADLAEQIRADRIDILMECAGHMAGNRLLVFARKPAPVQVAHPLYPNTTGLRTVDYRIMDPYIAPPSADARHTETILRLPETHCCYRPARIPVVPPIRPPAESRGYVTFGSFNNYAKVGESTIEAWSRILRAVPDAHLVLKWRELGRCDPAWSVDRFVRHGVEPERIHFLNWASDPYTPYLDIDICLDTFHANGGTTTCDALWMGVPVVSKYGEVPFSRVGLMHLSNVGLEALATDDTDVYVEIAVTLARDRAWLAELRSDLRERFRTSPIMNEPRYLRHLETAFRDIWRRWCEAQAGVGVAAPGKSRGSARDAAGGYGAERRSRT